MIEVAQCHARADLYTAACLASRPEMKPCCAIGCFACCSEAVYVAEAEVLHIIESLTPEQTVEIKMAARMARQNQAGHEPVSAQRDGISQS